MRHNCGYRKLNRTSSHRKSLLKNLAIALIKHSKIEPGVFKAKELGSYVEKLVSIAKADNSNAHRFVFSYLQNPR